MEYAMAYNILITLTVIHTLIVLWIAFLVSIRRKDKRAPPVQGNTVEEDAFEFSTDYKPFETNLSPQEYARHGFVEGQKRLIEKLECDAVCDCPFFEKDCIDQCRWRKPSINSGQHHKYIPIGTRGFKILDTWYTVPIKKGDEG
ncbi:MAG: hypothetical protein GY751_10770 [Bacteroidetes bacterium]|nr:hypothetical protein [Bacteroidota bacterium]